MKILTWLSVAVLACAPATGLAKNSQSADPSIAAQLDSLEYTYEVDADGDYQMVFDMADGRSQLVYVRSSTENYGSLNVREIWSPGFRIESGEFPAAVANRLLLDSNSAKIGSWVRQGDMAMYVVKIDVNASAEQLSDAIDAAIKTADKLEQELTLGADAF